MSVSGSPARPRTVQLRAGEPVREIFEIPAGGLRIEGKVGDARIPPGQISFDLYRGSQFEPGDKRPIVQSRRRPAMSILVPEGTYHIVSNYGDGNAMVRSDIRVQAGKLTDATVTHRAAVITLKLVNEQRRRGARQHPMVGAHPRRRRHQGIDRRLPARDPGRRRVSCHRPQRRQVLRARLQGGHRRRQRRSRCSPVARAGENRRSETIVLEQKADFDPIHSNWSECPSREIYEL